MDLELQEIVDTFLEEASEGLDAAESALIALESRPEDEEAIGTVFRATHTIKGNAGSLGFAAVAEFSHLLEDVLDRIRKASLTVTPQLITVLLDAVDALRRMVVAGAAGSDQLAPSDRELMQRLAAAAGGSPPERTGRVSPERGPGRRWEELGLDRALRVDREKLDRMLNLTGEIAIAHGRLRQTLGQPGGASGDALEAHLQADQLLAELQELVMKVRMVPLGPVFRRYVRTVRDLALAQGKQARLVLEGEDEEVDTTVVEHIKGPLTHLIRNAIDHGVEPPQLRAERGKDRCARLTLSARHDAGSIVLQVSDDGAGLDRERILARGRALGLVSEGVAALDQEVHRLILLPGFSTTEAVTELSGRGVGLDVVRRNIEALRGSVEVESQPGEGTTITLRLPLTLAIIAGLNVHAAGETFVIPLDSVVECIERPKGEGPRADGRGVIELRGRSLPFVRLGCVLGLGEGAPFREQVVVVRTGQGMAGLAVDAVDGESHTVIKPLGRQFRHLAGLAGASILSDGRIALILDVPALVRKATNARVNPASRVPAGGEAQSFRQTEKGRGSC
jgi:two-component system, chemotaxis family, sensor kinase CheA